MWKWTARRHPASLYAMLSAIGKWLFRRGLGSTMLGRAPVPIRPCHSVKHSYFFGLFSSFHDIRPELRAYMDARGILYRVQKRETNGWLRFWSREDQEWYLAACEIKDFQGTASLAKFLQNERIPHISKDHSEGVSYYLVFTVSDYTKIMLCCEMVPAPYGYRGVLVRPMNHAELSQTG